jgi:hypothetical protein
MKQRWMTNEMSTSEVVASLMLHPQENTHEDDNSSVDSDDNDDSEIDVAPPMTKEDVLQSILTKRAAR